MLDEIDGHRNAHVTGTSVRVHDHETRSIGRRSIVLRDVFAGAGRLIAFGDVPVGGGESSRAQPRQHGEEAQDSRTHHDATITSARAANFPIRGIHCCRCTGG